MRGGSSGRTGSDSATMAETQRYPEGWLRATDALRGHAARRAQPGMPTPPRVSFRHLFVQAVALFIGILAIGGMGVSFRAYRQVSHTEQDAQQQVQQVSDTLRQT